MQHERGNLRRSRATRGLTAVALLGGMLALQSGPADAAASGGDYFLSNEIQALSNTELDQHRGGLKIGGFMFHFGLKITSLVKDQLSLVTNLTMNSNGMWEETNSEATVADNSQTTKSTPPPLQTASDTVQKNTNESKSPSKDTVQNVVDNVVEQVTQHTKPKQKQQNENTETQTAAQQLQPTKKVSDEGVEVSVGNPQTTQIIHKVTQSHVEAIVSNTLNNQAIENTTEVNVFVSNFQEMASKFQPLLRARALTHGLGRR